MTRILLLAALAAGLSACSGGGEKSAASATPTASVSAATPESTSAPASEPATAPATPAAPVTPSTSASASASPPGRLRGIDAVVLGEVKPLKAGLITVEPEKGEKREAMLTPFTLVLDVQGGVCKEGKLPHRCNAEQLEKALKAGNTFYGKVTIKDGVAERIEEIVGE